MSYDLALYLPREGELPAETVARCHVDLECGADDALDRSEARQWMEQVASIVQHAAPQLERFVGPGHATPGAGASSCPRSIEFNERETPEFGVQISIFLQSMAISLPYWHVGEQASRAIALVRKICVQLAGDARLVILDPQIDQVLDPSAAADAQWEKVLQTYASISVQVAGLRHGPDDRASPTAPSPWSASRPRRWWQFWR